VHQLGCVRSKNTHTHSLTHTYTHTHTAALEEEVTAREEIYCLKTRLSWLASVRAGKMVKLGNNFSEKNNGKVVSEDGFDTIPLITPLDASQLQFPPPDKVVVKTKADYDGESKKGKLRSPKIAEFSISIIEGVSERLKVTLLVICALAFLVCVVFLVVYKVYQYEQPCPDSFVYTQGRCMPAGMYGNYPPQGPGGRGRLFTLINHYNIAKQTITRSVSPWMTIMSEEKVTQQETETAQKLA